MEKIQGIKIGLIIAMISIPSLIQASTIGFVTADQLNLRQSPSTNGMVVKQVAYGSSLELLNKEQTGEGWYRVLLDNNEVAYAKDEFVEVASVSGIVMENNLNCRSYPSLSQSQVITKLSKGTEVTILYRVGDFYKILSDGQFGFVYASYMDVPFAEYVQEQEITNVKDILTVQEVPVLNISEEVENTYTVSEPHVEAIEVQTENIIENNYLDDPMIGSASLSEEVFSVENGEPIDVTLGLDIVFYAIEFVGNPYVYGGNDLETGVDCSGFTQQVMKNFNISIPRTSREQSKVGMLINDFTLLQPGDLLFFGSSEEEITHVGIYVGGNLIVHASTPETGIIVSNISERGFATLQVARRMVQKE